MKKLDEKQLLWILGGCVGCPEDPIGGDDDEPDERTVSRLFYGGW